MRPLLPVFILLLLLITGCHTSRVSHVREAVEEVCREAVGDPRTDRCVVDVTGGKGKDLVLRGEVLSAETREKVVSAARRLHPSVLDSLVVLPHPGVGEKNYGLVKVSVANLRARPDHGAELVSQAVMGTPVRILKKSKDWYYIQTPDRYLAWTNASSVESLIPNGLEEWCHGARVICRELYGVVYADTLLQDRLSDLVAGAVLSGKAGNAGKERWCTVTLPDGRQGWAETALFLDYDTWIQAAEATPATLVATARKMAGIPYLWGGTSSKALDCSGFTKTVWFLNGILLERDASQQFRHGEVIDAGAEQQNLRPGDLLFFGRKEPLRIIHVGIYLGNREVIHASGQVAISSMDPRQPHFSTYLSGTYVGARRVVGMPSAFGYLPVKEHPWYQGMMETTRQAYSYGNFINPF